MFTAVQDAINRGYLDAEIEFVFVNRERGQTIPTDRFLDLVEASSIPLVTLSSQRFRRENGNGPWGSLRHEFEREALSRLGRFSPDVSVMAGFMLFTPELSRHMLLLNQHPALPSGAIGRWQDAIWEVIEKAGETHGSMMHIATPDLDRGPVVSTCSFALRGADFSPLWQYAQNLNIADLRSSGDENLPLFAAIRNSGVQREPHLVVETLRSIAQGAIDLDAIVKGDIVEPVDLTCKVDLALMRSKN